MSEVRVLPPLPFQRYPNGKKEVTSWHREFESRSLSPVRSASGAITSRRSRGGIRQTGSRSASTVGGAARTQCTGRRGSGGQTVLARSSRTGRGRRSDYQAPSGAETKRRKKQQVKPTGETKSQTGTQREKRGFGTFIAECIGELKKVDWPNQRQIVAGTVVVLIAIAVVGFYLFVLDEILRRFVRDVLLSLF